VAKGGEGVEELDGGGISASAVENEVFKKRNPLWPRREEL